MRGQEIYPTQYGLGFHCVGCPYRESGRCSGPIDLSIYNDVQKSFVGCADPNKVQYYSDLFRQHLPLAQSNQDGLEFDSRYIPQFFSRRRDRVLNLGRRIVYIALERLITSNGTINFSGKGDLLRALGVSSDTRIALVGTCRDVTLERFWTNSDRMEAWRKIADFGFEFVTGLSFSVYDDWPLFSQKFNQDRNFLSHDILSSLGVPCVPFLMPATDEDYHYLGHWLSRRSDIRFVAVHGTSFTRSSDLFKALIERMKRIELLSGRQLTFLVVGVAKPMQVRFILNEFDAIILNSRAVMEAMRAGNRYSANLTRVAARDVLRDELIVPNVLAFEGFCNTG